MTDNDLDQLWDQDQDRFWPKSHLRTTDNTNEFCSYLLKMQFKSLISLKSWIYGLYTCKRQYFQVIFGKKYAGVYYNVWWSIDLQNWISKIEDQDQIGKITKCEHQDQDQTVKIISRDLDHPKDQNQWSELDLLDQDQWSFSNSGTER